MRHIPRAVILAALKKGYGIVRYHDGSYQIKAPDGAPVFYALRTAKGVLAHLRFLKPTERAQHNPRRKRKVKYRTLVRRHGKRAAKRMWVRYHPKRKHKGAKRLTHKRKR